MAKRLVTYYQAERIKKFLFIASMLVLLVINCFPIFWMVFSSLKNNNDILSGNVGFSRVQKDIYSFFSDDKGVYVFSIDGSISKYDPSNQKLLANVTVKGQDANYAKDKDFFYLANSNTGIYKIDKKNLRIVAKTNTPLRGYDTNKFGNVSIESSEKNLYYTVEMSRIRNIYVYDKRNLKLTRTIQLPINVDGMIRSFFLKKGQLFIGTDTALLQFDLAKNAIVRKIDFGSDFYASGIEKILAIEGDTVYLLTQYKLYVMDLAKQKVAQKINFGLSRFDDGFIKDGKLWIANPDGLTVVDIKAQKIISQQSELIKELKTGIKVDTNGGYTSHEVSSLALHENELLLGSSYGRVSFLRIGESSPYASIQLPRGYRLVKWSNYSDLWKNIDFGLYLRNSIIISGFTMLFSMILATFAAYALVRYKFKGNREFGIAILSTQMIPQIMYLIPLFIMFKWLTDVTGIPIKGTFVGLIFIYTAFFVPFSIWILRSFFATIPVELEESARIDGCNSFQVFWKVSLPLAVPGIVATGIYVFLSAWDELMFAWVLTNGQTMTIPIGIRLFVGNFQNRYDLMMAAATVATVPVLVLFFLLQKHIVKGLTAGAVKG